MALDNNQIAMRLRGLAESADDEIAQHDLQALANALDTPDGGPDRIFTAPYATPTSNTNGFWFDDWRDHDDVIQYKHGGYHGLAAPADSDGHYLLDSEWSGSVKGNDRPDTQYAREAFESQVPDIDEAQEIFQSQIPIESGVIKSSSDDRDLYIALWDAEDFDPPHGWEVEGDGAGVAFRRVD
jgi:hypothetical protein